LALQLLNTLQNEDIDSLLLVDSIAINLASSQATAKRSALREIASYGRKTSHQGYSWGVRLHLLVSYNGAIQTYEISDGSVGSERQILLQMLDDLDRDERVTVLADKGYSGKYPTGQTLDSRAGSRASC
jgi:hypothetical protein